MKKFTTLMLSFLCIAALLTGCVESDIGVKLNADETGTISATIGIEEEAYEQLVGMGSDIFEGKETSTYEYDGNGNLITEYLVYDGECFPVSTYFYIAVEVPYQRAGFLEEQQAYLISVT